MPNAPRDENRVPGLLGISIIDGITTMPIFVNPANGALKIKYVTGGSITPTTSTPRDENRVTASFMTSSADGVTPLPIYVDNFNNLIVKLI